MSQLEQQLFSSKNNYYVATTENLFSALPLQEDIETDTLIIGGGLAGLATGLGLLDRGYKEVCLIESECVGYGASGRNGGFVFGGFSLDEPSLLKRLGKEHGLWAYQLTTSAVELIRQRIKQHQIECDITESGVILADWFKQEAALKAKQQWMKAHLKTSWEWLDQASLQQRVNSQRYYQGLWERNAFHIHPLKLVKGLAKAFVAQGGRCYEQTPALSIEPTSSNGSPTHTQITVRTPQGVIRAKQVVLASGGYRDNVYPKIARSILPISTYIMVTEPLGDRIASLFKQPVAIYDTRFAFDYYRPLPDTRLLWGGQISIRARNRQAIIQRLRKDMLKVFPSLNHVAIEYAWGGLMGYTTHQMPIIGRTHPLIWHVTGFGGHGVAPTTAGGELIAEAIVNLSNQTGIAKPTNLDRLHPFKPTFAGGPIGLSAAQATYWGFQLWDWWNEQRDRWLR